MCFFFRLVRMRACSFVLCGDGTLDVAWHIVCLLLSARRLRFFWATQRRRAPFALLMW